MKVLKKIVVSILTCSISLSTLLVGAAKEDSLITNGGFEEGFDGWALVNYFDGGPEDLFLTLNADEGQYSFAMMPGPTLRRDVAVDGPGVYRLTFRMRSTVAGGLRLIPYFYTATGAELKEDNFPDDIDARYATMTDNARRGLFGTGAAGWYDASFDISVQSRKVTMLRLDFSNIGADTAMAVDDFAIVKISDKANYVFNGQFENRGTQTVGQGWSNMFIDSTETANNVAGFLQTDSDGNQYFEWRNPDATRGGWSHQTLYLPSGRYKFSADFKGLANGDRIAFSIDPKLGEVDTLWENYGGISSWLEWVAIKDTWIRQDIYFTVPKDAYGNDMLVEATFYFPMNSRPNPGISTFFADNVALEEVGLSFAEFSAPEAWKITKKVYVKKDSAAKTVAKLSEVGPGGTLPVYAMYTPETSGTADSAMLALCLYQKTNDNEMILSDFKLAMQSVDITSDGVGGASGNGLVLFSDTITLPDALDDSYVAKAFIWRGGRMEAEALAEISY